MKFFSQNLILKKNRKNNIEKNLVDLIFSIETKVKEMNKKSSFENNQNRTFFEILLSVNSEIEIIRSMLMMNQQEKDVWLIFFIFFIFIIKKIDFYNITSLNE